jgi:hypothetical protein
MKKPVSAVLLAIGLGWPFGGCGGNIVAPLPDAVDSGLVLVDSANQTHFSLSVTDGAPTLTAVGDAGAASPSLAFTDEVTGIRYSLAVTSGALTLAPDTDAAPASQIGLTDSATSRTYSLAVVSGALTLIQN